MLEIASLMVSISKLHHYTNFSDRPPLSQYPGSAPDNKIPCKNIKPNQLKESHAYNII